MTNEATAGAGAAAPVADGEHEGAARAGWGWLAAYLACGIATSALWQGSTAGDLLRRSLAHFGDDNGGTWLHTASAVAGAVLGLLGLLALVRGLVAQRTTFWRVLVGVLLLAALADVTADGGYLRWLFAGREHADFPHWIRWLAPTAILGQVALTLLVQRALPRQVVRPPTLLRWAIWLGPPVAALRFVLPLLTDELKALRQDSVVVGGVMALVTTVAALSCLAACVLLWRSHRGAGRGESGARLATTAAGESLEACRAWLLTKLGALLLGVVVMLVAARAQSLHALIASTAFGSAVDVVCTSFMLASLWGATAIPEHRGARTLLAIAFVIGCVAHAGQSLVLERAHYDALWRGDGSELLSTRLRWQWILEALGVAQVSLLLVALATSARRLELDAVATRAIGLTTLGLFVAVGAAVLREAALRGAIRSAGGAMGLGALVLVLAIVFVAGVASVIGEVARGLRQTPPLPHDG